MTQTGTEFRGLHPPVRVWAGAGVAAPLLSFIGVHVMHPPGAPEHMTDAQVRDWITPAAGQITVGGCLGLVVCMMLLAFAQGWSGQLVDWGTPPWAARVASTSITVAAAVLGMSALLQVTAGLSSLPSERIGELSLVATLLNLYGALALGAWILLAPAVLAGLLALSRLPRWAAAVSVIATLPVLLCLALPPVSWGVIGAWLIAVSTGCLANTPTRHT